MSDVRIVVAIGAGGSLTQEERLWLLRVPVNARIFWLPTAAFSAVSAELYTASSLVMLASRDEAIGDRVFRIDKAEGDYAF